MIKTENAFALTAADLVGYLNCRHLTVLNRAVVEGRLTLTKPWNPLLQILWERGARHTKLHRAPARGRA